MKKISLAIVLSLQVTFAFPAVSAPITGNRFLEFNDHAEYQALMATSAYHGVIAGMTFAEDGKSTRAEAISECVDGWTSAQLGAVVKRFLEREPSTRHFDIGGIVVLSLYDACDIAL